MKKITARDRKCSAKTALVLSFSPTVLAIKRTVARFGRHFPWAALVAAGCPFEHLRLSTRMREFAEGAAFLLSFVRAVSSKVASQTALAKTKEGQAILRNAACIFQVTGMQVHLTAQRWGPRRQPLKAMTQDVVRDYNARAEEAQVHIKSPRRGAPDIKRRIKRRLIALERDFAHEKLKDLASATKQLSGIFAIAQMPTPPDNHEI